jgi:predicted nuclease with TOPRIM domain
MALAMTDAELYEADFYAWTQVQADRLRRLQAERANLDLDLPHLAEEVEDLGKAERNLLRSHLRRIIEHCLKLEWRLSIIEARIEISDHLTATLRRDVADELPRLHEQARRLARQALIGKGEADAAAALPADCPYTLDQLLDDDWYPTNRHGVRD